MRGALKTGGIYDLTKAYHSLNVGDGTEPTELIEATREFDNAFVPAGRATEIAVLAGAVLNEVLLSKRDSTSDCVALAIVVPAFQGLRKANPIPQLVTSAEQYLADRSADLRKPPKDSKPEAGVAKDVIDNTTQALKESQFPQAADHLGTLVAAQNKIMRGQAAEIRALEKRLLLLREESDVLWWLTGAHSRIVNQSFADLEPGAAALLVGRELADLTQIIPGPLAIGAFAKRMLGSTLSEKAEVELTLGSAINSLSGQVRTAWGEDAQAAKSSGICPLYSAIVHSLTVAKPAEWPPLFKKSQSLDAKLKCHPALLSRQLYLESLLLRAGN